MRYTGPKKKLCRREGINLFGSEKYDLKRGIRKPARAGKISEYGLQLRKKQTAKRMFGISEKQFASYYKKALQMQGVTGVNMLTLLHSRLDFAVYQAGFARTMMQARQFVNHGHFFVDGIRVDIPSFQVKPGMVITVRDKQKEAPLYKALAEEFAEFISKNASGSLSSAKWLLVDGKKLSITIERLPANDDFVKVIDIQKIIEFYSK